jgi:hypothetical protein
VSREILFQSSEVVKGKKSPFATAHFPKNTASVKIVNVREFLGAVEKLRR